MVKKRITSRDVAERAGVSRTTVSFVLNDVEGAQISEETRQRVLRVAREVGYTPHAAARSLVSGQTRTLGLVLCQSPEHIITDAYLPQVIYGLSTVSRERGFRVLLETVEDVRQPDAYIDLARAKHIDGILLSGPRSDDQQLPDLVEDGFPIVLLGHLPGTEVCSVDVDNREAARKAVRHLIALGHRRIACITNAPAHFTGANDRLEGYCDVLAEHGIPYDESLVAYGDFDQASGYTAAQELLDGAASFTALFAASDVVAFGAMAALRERGLRIPEDVAVVGFDDVPMAQYVDPPLTTVRLPAIEQGRLGGEILINLIEGKPIAEEQYSLETSLQIRQSCGATSISTRGGDGMK